MTYHTLIVYSSTDGQTQKICDYIASEIETQTHRVRCENIADVDTSMLAQAQQVIIGASIRYGKFQQDFHHFVHEHRFTLDMKDNAFFCVNLVARKNEKNMPHNNPYMIKLLKNMQWQPKKLGVFAGKLDYPAYKFLDKIMIRFIMWMTKGPTDCSQTYEFTRWERVSHFAEQLK
tara:strand:- start:6191 stop:6715 length:525 start_codon:yes stop_codon:yes gene_type:complete